MSLLLASLILSAPAMAPACTPIPAFDQVADLQSSRPLEASGNGLWIAGVRFRGKDIAATAVDQDPQSSTFAVDLQLSVSGKAKFEAIQRCRMNQLIEISFDGTAVSRPSLPEYIDGAVIRITGSFSQPQASRLAYQISEFR